MVELPAARTLSVRVVACANVGPRTRRISVEGEDLVGFVALPGQDVVLHLLDPAGGGVSRRYTIRNLDPGRGAMDLDVVLHADPSGTSDGPGARWAASVHVGDAIEVFGPRGKVQLADATWQLFAGDESALPAIAEMVAALPSAAIATAVIEVVDGADEQPLANAALDVRWIHRGALPAGRPELLVTAVQEAAARAPARDRQAYLFGESRVVRELRDLLGKAGFAPSEISAKGYWNVGRAG